VILPGGGSKPYVVFQASGTQTTILISQLAIGARTGSATFQILSSTAMSADSVTSTASQVTLFSSLPSFLSSFSSFFPSDHLLPVM